MPSPINLAYLHRLCKGDRARMAEYMGLYLGEAPGLFAELRALLATGDGPGLAKLAHGLRPQAHYMGATRICTLLDEVRHRAVAEGAEACADAVDECARLNDELVRALRTWAAAATSEGNR